MIISFIPQQVGMVYIFGAVPAIIYLYRRGKFRASARYIFLGISILLGFLIFAPIAPYQFQQVLLGEVRQLGVPLAVVIFFLVLLILITTLAGRVYCSSICPIGAIQEIFSHFPISRITLGYTRAILAIHLVIGGIFAGYALFLSSCLLKCMGIRSFFYLDLFSGWFWLFAAVMLLGLFVYRPFCRLICPYGLLLTVGGYLSLFRLNRTDACIKCKNVKRSARPGRHLHQATNQNVFSVAGVPISAR